MAQDESRSLTGSGVAIRPRSADSPGAGRATSAGRGALVISLDLELMWGMRDHATTRDYGHRVLGEREAIPAMLELFEKSGIHATWATVGRSEEHTAELQSLMRSSYAVFCLNKKK